MRIGPVLEVTTSFQHGKHGIEIRIESVNQDNSHSWVRISYGTVKYVIDSIEDSTQIPADPQEERVPQTSIKVVAARSKTKAKPQPRVLVVTTATIPIHERRWIDIEPSKQNLASYDVSKKVINLLRHNQTLHREGDGAIEFYRINSIFEIILHKYSIGLMSVGKLVWQQEDQNEDISIALIIREQFSTSVLCVGCDTVQADHAPEAGVAQGIFHGILVRHQGKHQEEVEEGLEEEVERRVKRENTQATKHKCACMDDME